LPTLGLIGSGAVGTSIARLAVAAGIDVVLSNSRGPHTLGELVEDLGERARAGTALEAAQAGDVVVVTIPLGGIDSLPAEALKGKVVVDTTNYYPGRDGHIASLDNNSMTASELVQSVLPDSYIVKAFNSIGATQIFTRARPPGAEDRSALPIAGNDSEAKATAAALINTLGFDTVDTGNLADSWRSEPNTPVYVLPYLGDIPAGLDDQHWADFFSTTPGRAVDSAEITRLAAAAQRGQAGGEWPSDN
jgi:8-hydroxy-5-deazaflavin:NADPH oxidoreductase